MGIKGLKWVRNIGRYRKALKMIDERIDYHDNQKILIESIIAGAANEEDLKKVDERDFIYHMNARNELYDLKRRLTTIFGE